MSDIQITPIHFFFAKPKSFVYKNDQTSIVSCTCCCFAHRHPCSCGACGGQTLLCTIIATLTTFYFTKFADSFVPYRDRFQLYNYGSPMIANKALSALVMQLMIEQIYLLRVLKSGTGDLVTEIPFKDWLCANASQSKLCTVPQFRLYDRRLFRIYMDSMKNKTCQICKTAYFC